MSVTRQDSFLESSTTPSGLLGIFLSVRRLLASQGAVRALVTRSRTTLRSHPAVQFRHMP